MDQSTEGTAYRKIDDMKIGFMDLPKEIRDKVYKEYFTTDDGIALHLIRRLELSGPIETCKLSTSHHDFVTLDDVDREVEDMENDIDDFMENCLLEIPLTLMLCAKSIHMESKGMVFEENTFKLMGQDDDDFPAYHSGLWLAPRNLVSRIKHLALDDGYLTEVFDVDQAGSRLWNESIRCFTGLQTMKLLAVSPLGILRFWDVMSMPLTIFLDQHTRTCAKVRLEQVHSAPWTGRPAEDLGCRDMTQTPRFFVPPVKELVIEGRMDLTSWEVMMDINYYGSKVSVVSRKVIKPKWNRMVCELQHEKADKDDKGDAGKEQGYDCLICHKNPAQGST